MAIFIAVLYFIGSFLSSSNIYSVWSMSKYRASFLWTFGAFIRLAGLFNKNPHCTAHVRILDISLWWWRIVLSYSAFSCYIGSNNMMVGILIAKHTLLTVEAWTLSPCSIRFNVISSIPDFNSISFFVNPRSVIILIKFFFGEYLLSNLIPLMWVYAFWIPGQSFLPAVMHLPFCLNYVLCSAKFVSCWQMHMIIYIFRPICTAILVHKGMYLAVLFWSGYNQI